MEKCTPGACIIKLITAAIYSFCSPTVLQVEASSHEDLAYKKESVNLLQKSFMRLDSYEEV